MTSKVSKRLHADWPHDLSYDKANANAKKFYSTIEGTKSISHSIFHNRRQVDIFLLSMALGWRMQASKKLKTYSRSIRRDALRENEVWLMCSVALAKEKSLDVLADPKKVTRICEEYANGGIDALIAMDNRSSPTSMPYEEEIEKIIGGNSAHESTTHKNSSSGTQ